MSVIGFVYCAMFVNVTTLTVMRGRFKLFSRKLSIVGFDWIAAATVDSNHSHFQSPNIF